MATAATIPASAPGTAAREATGSAQTPLAPTQLAAVPNAKSEATETAETLASDVATAGSSPVLEQVTANVSSRASSADSRTEKLSATRGAKIAATGENSPADKKINRNTIDKTFLSASGERVTKEVSDVGTGVAKPDVIMPATFSTHLAPANSGHAPVLSVSVAAVDRSADSAATSTLAPETAGTAQRAVEAVLTAADRFSAGDRHTVNLNFSVGGNDLNVRVELRADQVHATFRTDSPELRSALAHEWQAANSTDTGDRSQRLATPTFTSNSGNSDSSNASAFSGGDGSSRQRDTGARRSGDESFEVAALRSRGSRTSSSVETVAVSSAAPRLTSVTSRRLSAQA